jgi:hypothetical protein
MHSWAMMLKHCSIWYNMDENLSTSPSPSSRNYKRLVGAHYRAITPLKKERAMIERHRRGKRKHRK